MSSRVNQKLYYARLTLDQAEAGAGGPRREALREAAVWHLATAYRAHLADIAQSYRHPSSAESATALARELAGREVRCAAITELEQMERAGEWPAHLLHAMDIVSEVRPQRAEMAGGGEGQVDPLALKSVDTSPDSADCRRWLNAFESLVMAHREHLQEW